MAATVTAKSGHQLEYYRQQAAPAGERSPLSYYSAGARQGEPARAGWRAILCPDRTQLYAFRYVRLIRFPF